VIVYGESNFVLELALEQEEQAYAENILAAAERGLIALVVPAFSVAEPFSTVAQRSRLRKHINSDIGQQARQLERSAIHASLVAEIRSVTGQLANLDGHEFTRLQVTANRILRVATVVPMTCAILAGAGEYGSRFGLTLQDGIVLASTLDHVAAQDPKERKVFANRNPGDFDVPEIVNLLATYGCELALTFADAWKIIAPQCPRSR
jgi:predicted nucleic acid-binding protein